MTNNKNSLMNGNHILNNYKANSELMNKYNNASTYAQKLWNKIEKEG